VNFAVAEMPRLFGSAGQKEEVWIGCICVEYRVGVGDLRWVPSDIHCGAEAQK
jgi:hypothetical protein